MATKVSERLHPILIDSVASLDVVPREDGAIAKKATEVLQRQTIPPDGEIQELGGRDVQLLPERSYVKKCLDIFVFFGSQIGSLRIQAFSKNL